MNLLCTCNIYSLWMGDIPSSVSNITPFYLKKKKKRERDCLSSLMMIMAILLGDGGEWMINLFSTYHSKFKHKQGLIKGKSNWS